MDEKTTRVQLIDKQLKSAGWLKKYIKEEGFEVYEKIVQLKLKVADRNLTMEFI